MKRVYLDTGNLTDEELGVNRELDKQMRDLPTCQHERVLSTATRNGNVVIRRAR